ncbi:MAG: PLP-dependent aminotransferase family protein [Burkholderiales bacterium]|nr:PLP-dependent aminotransferase family protein [Burkholderiales bacterium]
MTFIALDPTAPSSLTDQIVEQIRGLIDTETVRSGQRMPSIRRFAREHRISAFTVIAAYERLVALGYLSSRKGSGFYVAPHWDTVTISEPPSRLDQALDSLSSLGTLQGQKLAFAVPHMMASIAGRRSEFSTPRRCHANAKPTSWLDPRLVQKGLRSVAQGAAPHLVNYGEAYGYLPLRELLVRRLGELNINVSLQGIVTTHGASHAFDLVARYLVRPGDVVLVEDPGYLILYRHLKLLGAKLVGIPRTLQGPDPSALEAAIKAHRPRVFFVNSVLQNPTGSSISPAVAHRIVRLAESHDLIVIEDDAYCDLAPDRAVRLAALDQLRHVVYVGSYSKTISCDLRVGFIACSRELGEELVDIKVLTGLTTCETNERLVHDVLAGGAYRRHVEGLRRLLEQKRDETIRGLVQCGLELYCTPDGGTFIWARIPGVDDSNRVARLAARDGVALVPGSLFRPDQEASPWIRFNAAFCEDPRMFRELEKISQELDAHVPVRGVPSLRAVTGTKR